MNMNLLLTKGMSFMELKKKMFPLNCLICCPFYLIDEAISALNVNLFEYYHYFSLEKGIFGLCESI